jgi:hypothetical protein
MHLLCIVVMIDYFDIESTGVTTPAGADINSAAVVISLLMSD